MPKFAATYGLAEKGPKFNLPLNSLEALDAGYDEISTCAHLRRNSEVTKDYKNEYVPSKVYLDCN